YGPSTTAPSAVGDYTASATYAGDSNYSASNDSKDFSIAKASQTITFNPLANKTFGDADFTVSATASSGLAVSFNATGNCSNSGSTVHITGAGSCTVTASQGGDASYNAAADVPQSFSIAKASQSISFGALADKTYGDADFNVSASATSGLSVSFSASGNCSSSGSTIHITGAGACTVTASQGGDSNYNAAASVDQSFNIAKAAQTITFGALTDKTYGDADFNVSASSSSGLAVGFAASGDCTVSGSTVHITGAGACTITASQAGDANYNAAADVPQSFSIAKAAATVTLSNLSYTYDGTAKSATAATSPSGLSVTITYAPASQAQRARNTASSNPTDAGSYTVTATINDPNYEGSASDTLVIAKADATVSVVGYSGAYDGASHGATGTATGAQGEDLASLFDFGSSYTNVPGGTAHWTFNASNTNTNYNPASGDVSITITKATPSINWSNPADIIYGTALGAAQLNATASTAGSLSYSPAAGTVLSSGNGQTLHASFTPTDTTNYNGATKDVSINVLTAVLSVSMTADRNPAPVGLNFNYKAIISNTGNASSAATTLTDVLPTQVTFTSVSSTQGTCAYSSTTRAVTCSLGAITPGSSVNVQITVKPRDEGTLNDTASLTAGQWDPAAGGNSSASVNGLQSIKLVDLSVSKTDSADPIFVGDNTTYTMIVKNSNTAISATGVALTDNLPSGMTFVSATTSQGSLVTPPVGSTGIVTANVGTMAPNANVTVTVTVKGATAGVQTNTATVSANETDSNTANNSASQSTTVKAVVVVGLQKVLLASQVLTGGCQNTTGNVYLTAAAPAGGVNVNLSSNVSGASVPASVFIPAGQMVSPAFNVTTSPVTAKQTGLVTATSGPNSVSRGITINVGNGTCP
ncbi:MAG: MBG domain-containing protein, partial [Pyrinomonadaceae bacterium]